MADQLQPIDTKNVSTEKQQVVAFYSAFETLFKGIVSPINHERYIQHNLSLSSGNGVAGAVELGKILVQAKAKVTPVRVFQVRKIPIVNYCRNR